MCYNIGMKTGKKPARTSITPSALARVIFIDRRIASGEYPSQNVLRDYLLKNCCREASIATIQRDIDFMRDELNAPIEYDAGHRGYYYSKPHYRIPLGFAGADELLALGMAKSILALYRDTPIYNAARNLMECITLPLAEDGNSDWLENRIVVPKIASAKINPDIWKIVVAGLKENRIITFDYRGIWDEEFKNRRVRPYQLLFDSGMWYLHGFSEERKALRMFSLSRMKNAQLGKDGFSLPKNFNYDDLAGGSYFGVFIGHDKMRFAIDCYGEAMVYATDRQWAADQKITEIDGGITIEFTSTQYLKVLKWLLSCGCNAIPRKPQKLVDEWTWHISEMRKLVSR